jgi:hypothetical protein
MSHLVWYTRHMIMNKAEKDRNWMVTFGDGSTAKYWNTTAVEAVNMAVRDWYHEKTPVAWRPFYEKALPLTCLCCICTA